MFIPNENNEAVHWLLVWSHVFGKSNCVFLCRSRQNQNDCSKNSFLFTPFLTWFKIETIIISCPQLMNEERENMSMEKLKIMIVYLNGPACKQHRVFLIGFNGHKSRDRRFVLPNVICVVDFVCNRFVSAYSFGLFCLFLSLSFSVFASLLLSLSVGRITSRSTISMSYLLNFWVHFAFVIHVARQNKTEMCHDFTI